MMSHFKYPFFDGLKEHPPGRKKDLQKMRNWLAAQSHLPEISDEFIYLFLHACYYNQDRARHALDSYFSLRSRTPALFSNRDVDSKPMQTMLEIARIVRLPKETPDGCKVIMLAVKDRDPTKLYFPDAVKGFCMFNDCVLSEDGLVNGYVVLFDMKDVQLGHLARVSLPALRAFMTYIQESHPARLKAVHVLNTANYINHILRIIMPLVRSDLIPTVKFHKGSQPDNFPVEILPADYGGDLPSIDELEKETLALIDKYRHWLIHSENVIKVDESKRVKKPSWWGLFNGSNQEKETSLEEQKKSFLKNLQID